MSNSLKSLEIEANKSARSYMGKIAWPTIMLGLTVTITYLSMLYGIITAALPLWLGFIIASICTYAIYTVVHDGVHGCINGKNRSLEWLNNSLGYLGGQIMFVSFRAHKLMHLAHHHYTNQPGKDPDLYLDDDSVWSLIKGTIRVLPLHYIFIFKSGNPKITTRDKITVTVELFAMIAWRFDLPLLGGPPFKLESGGYGRPVGLTVTECRTGQQGEAR